MGPSAITKGDAADTGVVIRARSRRKIEITWTDRMDSASDLDAAANALQRMGVDGSGGDTEVGVEVGS